MAFPTVHVAHPDEAPLDVLMTILGSGKTSLLYKNLVKDGKAVQAQAGHGCEELSCEFTILALPTPGHSLQDLEKLARDSLVEFETRGANDDDLTRVKTGIISSMIYGLESVQGKVSQLAAYQTFRDNPNSIQADISRYENVTKADVLRVYKKYIKGKPAVVMSIVPKGQTNTIIKADTWQRYERKIPEVETVALKLRPGVSNFDRSVTPPSGPNPNITLPELYKLKTKSGAKVIAAINDEVPTTTIQIRIAASQSREALDKLGLAALTTSMMDEATQKSTAEELANELEKRGSSVGFRAENNYSVLSIRSLTKNLDKTLAIAAEKLNYPKFAQYSNLGTIDTVQNLTVNDVQTFYAQNYGAKNAEIILVSDLTAKSIASKLKAFDGWSGGNTPLPETKPYPELASGTLYIVDKPDAAQSEIRIGKRSLNYDATGEFYRSQLMNYNLGGAFNSRINLNLREDKGYSYGARSSFNGNKYRGTFLARAAVRTDATAASIVEFQKEITAFKNDGLTPGELLFLKRSISQRDARDYETPTQKLRFLTEIITYDLDESFVQERNSILAKIDVEELNGLAAKHLDVNDMITLVVGDKKVIEKSLAKVANRIVELKADGSVIKN